VTITEQGQLLAGVIQNYMALPDGRVILGNENFDGPKDSSLYVLVIYDGPALVGVNSKQNYAADTETMSTSSHDRFLVEVVSRGYDADNRYGEIYMAISSIAGTRAAEDAGVAFFRGGNALNLTAIEGVKSLRRWQIPVIITNVQSKTSSAAMIDKFTTPTINTEA
jgi:hypothetical protein